MTNHRKTADKNTLNQSQTFQLLDWLRANLETLKNLTYPAVAARASDAMGFRVTEPNIFGISRSANLGLGTGAQSKPLPVSREEFDSRVGVLEAVAHQFSLRLAALERETGVAGVVHSLPALPASLVALPTGGH